jgi:hypothetical protein
MSRKRNHISDDEIYPRKIITDYFSNKDSNYESDNKPIKKLMVYPRVSGDAMYIGRELSENNTLSIQNSETTIGSYDCPNSITMDYFTKSGDDYMVSCVSENEIDLKIFYLDGGWKVSRRTKTLKAYIAYTLDSYGTKKAKEIKSGRNIDLMQGQKSIEIYILFKNSLKTLQIIYINNR